MSISGRDLRYNAIRARRAKSAPRATLQYAAVSSAYPRLDPLDFRADTMQPLFRYAEECAQEGRLWTPFRHTGDDGRTAPMAETQEDPCPADDVFIRYFALR